jgi:hypothetical protein
VHPTTCAFGYSEAAAENSRSPPWPRLRRRRIPIGPNRLAREPVQPYSTRLRHLAGTAENPPDPHTHIGHIGTVVGTSSRREPPQDTMRASGFRIREYSCSTPADPSA